MALTLSTSRAGHARQRLQNCEIIMVGVPTHCSLLTSVTVSGHWCSAGSCCIVTGGLTTALLPASGHRSGQHAVSAPRHQSPALSAATLHTRLPRILGSAQTSRSEPRTQCSRLSEWVQRGVVPKLTSCPSRHRRVRSWYRPAAAAASAGHCSGPGLTITI